MCCPIVTNAGCGCSLELCCKVQGFYNALCTRYWLFLLAHRSVEGRFFPGNLDASTISVIVAAVFLSTLAICSVFLMGVYQKMPRLLWPYLRHLLGQICLSAAATVLVSVYVRSLLLTVICAADTCLCFYMLRAALSYRYLLLNPQLASYFSHGTSAETVIVDAEQQPSRGEIRLASGDDAPRGNEKSPAKLPYTHIVSLIL